MMISKDMLIDKVPIEELHGELQFILQENKWVGEFTKRHLPHTEWYLRIGKKGNSRVFKIKESLLWAEPIAAYIEAEGDPKWWDFEGLIPIGRGYSNKSPTVMKIIDRGQVDINIKRDEDKERILLNFKGEKLQGEWELMSEKEVNIYSFTRLSSLTSAKFCLQKHIVAEHFYHWDLMVDTGRKYNHHWYFLKDPMKLRHEPLSVKFKRDYDKNLFCKRGSINQTDTFFKNDEGVVDIISMSPSLLSLQFHGKYFKGHYTFKMRQGKWTVYKIYQEIESK